MSCRIITGERGSGKTHRILALAEKERHPEGFASYHIKDEYFLKDLKSGRILLVMTKRPVFPDYFLHWRCSPVAFSYADSVLKSAESGSPIFIDEVGRLELEGRGFASSLRILLERDANLTLAVRKQFVQSVIDRFGIENPLIQEVEAF